MNSIKKLDSFSIPISFTFQGRRQASSLVGVFFTVSLIAFIIFIGIYVSSELWKREAPQLNISTYFSQEKIYLRDYPLLFGIYNVYNQPQYYFENYLSIDTYIMNTSNSDQAVILQRKIVPCSQKFLDFSPEVQKQIKNIANNKGAFCVDFEQDDYIIGEVATPNSQSLVINYRACVNDKNCKSMDEIKQQFSGSKVITYQGNTIINGIDKDEPLQHSSSTIVMMFSFSLYKQNFVNLQIQKVKSNDGVFQDNWTLFKGYSNQQINQDYSDIYSASIDGSLLGVIGLGASSQIQLTTRQYMMFSEALARTMGYYGALHGILAFILAFYQQYTLRMDFQKTLLRLGYEIQENECKELEIVKVSNLTKSGKNPRISSEKRNKILRYLKEYNFFTIIKLTITGICKKRDNQLFDQLYFYSKVDQLIQNLLSLERLFSYILPKEIIDHKGYQSFCQNEIGDQNKLNLNQRSFEEFDDQIDSVKTKNLPHPSKKLEIQFQKI